MNGQALGPSIAEVLSAGGWGPAGDIRAKWRASGSILPCVQSASRPVRVSKIREVYEGNIVKKVTAQDMHSDKAGIGEPWSGRIKRT